MAQFPMDPSTYFRPHVRRAESQLAPGSHPLEPSLKRLTAAQLREAFVSRPLAVTTSLPPTPPESAETSPEQVRPLPVRAFTLATTNMTELSAKPKIAQPKNMLFIEPDVPRSTNVSPSTTPTEGDGDPLASAGQDLKPKTEANGRSTQTKLPDVHAEPALYYGEQQAWSRARTFSSAGAEFTKRRPPQMGGELINRARRLSHDESTPFAPRRYLVDVEETMRIVLEQEDTDQDFQISIYDSGPKLLSLGTASSNAYKSFDIRGTYMLSNLLQELALARDYGRKRIVLDEARLAENPVDRLSRMIKNSFWNALTRRIDAEGLRVACADPKNRSKNSRPIIYIPHGEDEMADHYRQISKEKPELNLDVVMLPPVCDDPVFVKSLNDKPGILALAMERKVDPVTQKVSLEALPFVVPGARFNEKYGWDSYFMALGLLVDGKIDLAMSIVEHCIFEVKHYNKVLNGNRSYYLCRSQPPFLTDLALQIYNQFSLQQRIEKKEWLRRAIQAAIKEYHRYWMVEPALDPVTGLSRYRPVGSGIPPETEASHFTHILQPYAQRLGISVNEYIDGYNDLSISEPELDEYFQHDRGVRESGHDTTYRLEKRCADLATVDLNSLLYKYENDIAQAILCVFDDNFEIDEEFDLSPWPITPEAFAEGAPRRKSNAVPMTSVEWMQRAEKRKAAMNEYCWNEGLNMFFDYDTKTRKQTRYESVTTLWPLWAGLASEEQALKLTQHALPKFEVAGGLVSGTEESRGIISLDRPNRQWDYPFSWPPHQIMAWVGFERYGFVDEAARLAYRWIYMMVLSFVDFNGIVPEKFDAVELSHMVDAEYGNQGTDFKYVPREGFGWMNAAFQVGIQCLSTAMRRAVAACVPPWVFFGLPAPDFPSARRKRAEREARDAAAAAAGHGGEPRKTAHQHPPSLNDAIAQLREEFGVKQ